MKAPTLLLVPLWLLVASCTVEYGEGKITPTIDPNLPREDPASYPDDPIVSVPPVIACPTDSLNNCQDAGAAADDSPGAPDGD
jgi:hypothetical protein